MANSKNILIAVLGLTTLGAIGLAWREHRERVRLEALVEVAAEQSGVRTRLREAESQVAELKAEAARTARLAVIGRAGAAAPNPPRTGESPPARGFGAELDRPEVQRLRALQQRAALDGRYAALFKALKLSPDQLSRFKDLLVEQQSTLQDVMMAARAQGLDPRENPEALQSLVKSTQAEMDAAIQALLGPSDYTAYQDYQRTQPQRSTVSQLTQSLSYTSEPLTETQATELVRILGATAPAGAASTAAPPGPGGFGGGGGGATISDQAVAQASGVLSAGQVQALKDLQQLQQTQQQTRSLLRGPAEGAPPPGGG